MKYFSSEKEYLDFIQKLRDKLNKNNTEEIFGMLQEIFAIKPTRAAWFIARAECMYKAEYALPEIYKLMKRKIFSLLDSDNIFDLLKLYQEFACIRNDKTDEERILFQLETLHKLFEIKGEENKEFLSNSSLEMTKIFNSFRRESSEDILCQIVRQCYIQENFVPYIIFLHLLQEQYNRKVDARSWITQLINMSYMEQKLKVEENSVFVILVTDEMDEEICNAIAKALSLLGKKAYLIEKSVTLESENKVVNGNLLDASIENAVEVDNYIIYQPRKIMCEGEILSDNRDYILEYIKQQCGKEQGFIILSNKQGMDSLYKSKVLQKHVINLYNFQQDYYKENLLFGWYGDYLSYISSIYKVDCKKLMATQSKVYFSIVIPARNSAVTLRYTLQTCLEQTYQGDYEIIISDNSTGKNSEVYELCKELNDPRIVYVKTPRELPLPKSFEFAYLHAKGEYIFALGSDDGLLPWALEVLEKVTIAYPKEEIIQWERGFYAWPGFNGGQQNKFVIPRKYSKGQYDLFYQDNIDYIASVLNNPQNMYLLPMLYINSCFKREYLYTLLERTGRLWDGICQDIYMGVVTVCIYPKILNMKYPLAIAGMSSGSVGANANKGKKTNEEFEKMMQEISNDNNMGGFCSTYYERLLPQTGTDTSSLYSSLLRMISIGILPEAYLTDVFNWEKMFAKLASELDIRDVAFDRKIHEMRYAAMQHGDEFLQWFDKNIYNPMLEPRLIDERQIEKLARRKTYSNTTNSEGGIILDASEYGVKNIYNAVKLFVQLSEL